jgi:hypothetical protein
MRGKDLDSLSRYVQVKIGEGKEEDVDEQEGGNEEVVGEEKREEDPADVEEPERDEKSEEGQHEVEGNREEEKENKEFEDEKLEADKIIGSILEELEGGETQPSSLVRRLRDRLPRKPSRVMTSPSYDIAGAQGGKRRKFTVKRRTHEKVTVEKSKVTVEVNNEEKTPEVLPKSSFVDLKGRKKNTAEKRLLTELNKDVYMRGKLDIRMPDPKVCAFYHNLKIEEFKDEGLLHLNKCLQHFLGVICDR